MRLLLEYVRNIGYFLILMSLVSNVMPDNSYKKYCRMFCGLILMILVINPFYNFMNMEGDFDDMFANASFKAQINELETQLITNDDIMNKKVIREYELLILDELQKFAKEEGIYILDITVDIEENEAMEETKLSRLNVFITMDATKYQEINNGDIQQGDIYVDEIRIGFEDNIALEGEENNINPRFISFVNKAADYLEIDTNIINIVEDKEVDYEE